MRITHVIDTLDPAAGGPPVVAASLAAAQAALGHEVAIVAYAPIAPDADARIAAAYARIPGFDQLRRPTVPWPTGLVERLLSPRARRALLAALAGAEVMHLHGVWAPILKLAATRARAGRIPYAIAPHGMLDPWSLAQKRFKKRLALALGYRAMLDNAAFLHVLNADEQRLLDPLRLRPPAHVLPNGIFPDEFRDLPDPAAFAASRPQLAGRPYVLFLSRLHYKKGLDFLADAFAQVAAAMPEPMLVVAGPDGGERAPFEQRIAALGLADRVILTGPLYGPEKLAALAGAACFCLPSRQEGFSMAITEALACGIPAVISDACHFPEVADADAGIVTPLDPKRIADALLSILRAPPRRSAMGSAGRALVLSRFTWPAIAERTLAFYAGATDRPTTGY